MIVKIINKIQKEYKRFIKRQYNKFISFVSEPNPYIPDNLEVEEEVVINRNVTILSNCKIGKYSYIGQYSFLGPNTTIGRYCSIAFNVCIAPGQHPSNFLSTHLFQYSYYKSFAGGKGILEYNGHKSTIIGDDVWIGRNAVIMDGVTVGNGAIIGANAVITKDVPPYAIVGGVPGKIIKYRFSEEIIEKLLSVKWWEIDEKILKDLPFQDVDKCLMLLADYKTRIEPNKTVK